MSRGYASHSTGLIFNEVDDGLNHHQVYEICQNLMWLESNWWIAYAAHFTVINQSGMSQSLAKFVW